MVGGVLWYLYNLMASVVLLNLLIALMGVIMRDDLHLSIHFLRALVKIHVVIISDMCHKGISILLPGYQIKVDKVATISDICHKVVVTISDTHCMVCIY